MWFGWRGRWPLLALDELLLCAIDRGSREARGPAPAALAGGPLGPDAHHGGACIVAAGGLSGERDGGGAAAAGQGAEPWRAPAVSA